MAFARRGRRGGGTGSGMRRRFGVAVTAVTVILGAGLTACSDSATDSAKQGSGDAGKKARPVAEKVQLQQTPAPGAKNVNPTSAIKVSTKNGTLRGVRLTGADGTVVKGGPDEGNHTWRVGEPLGYGKTYRWSGTAVGKRGAQTPVGGSFSTVDPDNTVSADLNVGDGQTYGIAMPIKVDFDTPPENKAAVEKALSVKTSPHVDGSWAWLSDSSVHWRPAEYWKPGTKVSVGAKMYGLDMGEGEFGDSDVSSSFTIGRAQVAKGNVDTHRFKVYNGDRLIGDYPASYGLDSVDWRNTRSGTHVVMSKHSTYSMNNPRGGYSDVPVSYAVRLSNNGEFTHAYPQTTYAQGETNVSHGCINLSTENAENYYEYAQVGDPVEITGSNMDMDSSDGDYYDWTVPWSQWKQKSALS